MLCDRAKPELGGGAASLLGGAAGITSSFLIVPLYLYVTNSNTHSVLPQLTRIPE